MGVDEGEVNEGSSLPTSTSPSATREGPAGAVSQGFAPGAILAGRFRIVSLQIGRAHV